MKDVTLKNGTVMTDAEFVQQRGMGDTLTEFVATKEDLKILAKALADKLLDAEFILKNFAVGRSDSYRADYTTFRFERVMHFLPEMEAEIQERLSVGREENERNAALHGYDPTVTLKRATLKSAVASLVPGTEPF